MMKPITLDRAMTLTSLGECREQTARRLRSGTLTSSVLWVFLCVFFCYRQQPSLESHNFSIPALVPPNCLIAFGLKRCHDYVHIIVPIPQHALLVGRHHGVGRQPANRTRGCSSRCLSNPYSKIAINLYTCFYRVCLLFNHELVNFPLIPQTKGPRGLNNTLATTLLRKTTEDPSFDMTDCKV